MKEKVAIIINTRNRRKEFFKTLWEILNHSSALFHNYTVKIFTIDDASDSPYYNFDYHFTHRVGIPKAKNKGLRLAYDWGAQHYFLFDDDCYPISCDWYKPYITNGQNHLAYTFTDGWEGTDAWGQGRIDDFKNVKVNELSCGCMMYIRRKVLDVVGGFDEEFGLLSKYCDTEWQRRIHNAGLSCYPFQDVIGSDKLFHSMDKDHEVKRSFSKEERELGIEQNKYHYMEVMYQSRYCPF